MITIGTDCSGIEAPIEALIQLGIPFQHKWSCEIDPFARQSILANYHPEIFYTDITTRDHSQLPDVDLYVCGFPCQSFSLMGKKRGTRDPRSNIMLHCIKVIETKLPNLFILENVKNFKFIEKGAPFNHLITSLTNIQNEHNESIYNVYYDILNTKDYGIPQNRERIFIIGVKKNIQIKEFTFPTHIPLISLDEFIIDKTIHNNTPSVSLQKNINKSCNKTFIVTPFSYYFPIRDICHTLTTQSHCYYHKIYKRNLSPIECLRLQGFKNNFKQVVSNTQLYKQIGNSMSVNVLCALYKNLFNITNYNI